MKILFLSALCSWLLWPQVSGKCWRHWQRHACAEAEVCTPSRKKNCRTILGLYNLVEHRDLHFNSPPANPVTSTLFSTLKGVSSLSCMGFLVKTNFLSQLLKTCSKMNSSMKCDFPEFFFSCFVTCRNSSYSHNFCIPCPKPLHCSHIPGSQLIIPPEHQLPPGQEMHACTDSLLYRCYGALEPTKWLQSSPCIASLSELTNFNTSSEVPIFIKVAENFCLWALFPPNMPDARQWDQRLRGARDWSSNTINLVSLGNQANSIWETCQCEPTSELPLNSWSCLWSECKEQK